MSGSGRLTKKIAIITGGASGIGAATVRVFVREGAAVLIADVQDEKGAALAAELGPNVAYQHVDVSKEADVQAVISAVSTRHGRLDILVADAGVESQKREVDTSEAEWDRIMAVNAKGVFFCTKHAIPLMRASGGGSIINLSSAFGIVGSAGFAAYHASKGAVRAFTKSTAIANARYKIRANSIHPGGIDTPMLRTIFAEGPDPAGAEAAYTGMHPLGRLGLPEDIANGALYLASDESSFVTGLELVIDGGLLAQ